MTELSLTALRSRALAMLARREHSQAEIKQKLTELGAKAEDIQTIVHELSSKEWQSDQRFAEAYSRSYARKGYGPLHIKQELKQRGISAELIELALEQEDWFALAQQVRQKKFGTEPPQERKEQARQLRFLQYRGFNSEQCWASLRLDDAC